MPLAHRDVERAEPVVAVVRGRGGHGIRDERDPPGRRLEGQRRDVRVHVVPVEHELEGDPLVLEGRDDRSGLAVMDARHRVEDVGQDARPAIEGCSRGLRVGSGVPDRDDDPVPGQVLDRVERAGQFGRDRDLPQGAASGGDEFVDDFRVGLAQVLEVVRAAPIGRQVRPLEVGAEDERVAFG